MKILRLCASISYLCTVSHSMMRFEERAPLPGLSPIKADVLLSGNQSTQNYCRQNNLQGRVFWIDATANLKRVDTQEKVSELVKKIKDHGFNTIVYDVKPIVGFPVYPSNLAPKITEWKGQTLPLDADPLKWMSEACHEEQICLLANFNAFSEGHSWFNLGAGYKTPDLQTVLLDSEPLLYIPYNPSSLAEQKKISLTLKETKENPSKIWYSINLAEIKKCTENAYWAEINNQGRVVKTGQIPENYPSSISPKGGILVGVLEGRLWIQDHLVKDKRCEILTEHSFPKVSERPKIQIPLMMNPHHPEVQKKSLAFVEEVLSNYSIQGIVFDDRLRYGGFNYDFSPYTQELFEKYVGKKLKWPEDVFSFTYTFDLKRGVEPGPYWDLWWTWRAKTLKDWLKQVRTLINKKNSELLLGLYVGSWFAEYWKNGLNYGMNDLESGFPTMQTGFQSQGVAEEVDLIMAGCYYSIPTVVDAMRNAEPTGKTVEAAAKFSNSVVGGKAWVYAGIKADDYFSDPSKFSDSLQAACAHTQGVMVFDLSHIEDFDDKLSLFPIEEFKRKGYFWRLYKQAFSQFKKAPHCLNRDTLIELRKYNKKEPILMYEGRENAGF